MDSLSIVILAAGKGTRMRSRIPKVLHKLGGAPLLSHVLDSARSLNPEVLAVVVGHEAEQVTALTNSGDVTWVQQPSQSGTGDAVKMAIPHLSTTKTLILYGDVPCITSATLQSFIDSAHSVDLSVMTVNLGDPSGYGRIVRDAQGDVQGIREQKDASALELEITECNTGIMVCDTKKMGDALNELNNDNAQGEYYLTDLIEMFVSGGSAVGTFMVKDPREVEGVNSRAQLETLERYVQANKARTIMEKGVTLADASRFDARGIIKTGIDCSIDINCIFEGEVILGDGVEVGANCYLKDCVVGDFSTILPNSVIESSELADHVTVGPFARVRPGTELQSGARLGNFVETKNAIVGLGSKINHLSYVGDAVVGKGVNIGAGTITCNYDGANKWQTIVGDGAFIGSNSALVAPVEVGSGATIGAGTVLTKAAPSEQLTLARAKQVTLSSWTRPIKKTRK